MNPNKFTKPLLAIGIVASLSGFIMEIADINYGKEILIIGLVFLMFGRLLPVFIKDEEHSSENQQEAFYPSIIQSFGMVGIFFLVMITIGFGGMFFHKIIEKEVVLLINYLVTYGGSFWIFYKIRKRETHHTSFNVKLENFRMVPFLIVGSITLLFLIERPYFKFILMFQTVLKSLVSFDSSHGLAMFVMMVIAGPVYEELIFRGIMLDGLLEKYSPITAILISSFLFGLIHLHPVRIVLGIILGLFCGWAYFKTRNLLPSIIIHFCFNLSSFLFMYIVDLKSFMNGSVVKMPGDGVNGILLYVGAVILLVASIYLLNKEFDKGFVTQRCTEERK